MSRPCTMRRHSCALAIAMPANGAHYGTPTCIRWPGVHSKSSEKVQACRDSESPCVAPGVSWAHISRTPARIASHTSALRHTHGYSSARYAMHKHTALC